MSGKPDRRDGALRFPLDPTSTQALPQRGRFGMERVTSGIPGSKKACSENPCLADPFRESGKLAIPLDAFRSPPQAAEGVESFFSFLHLPIRNLTCV